MKSVDEQRKYLEFLKALKGLGTDVSATQSWTAHITDLVEYLGGVVAFNEFIMKLYGTLSQYKVQSDVSRYNVLDLSNWGKARSEQGIHIGKSNFRLFLEKVKGLNIAVPQKISRIAPSEAQIATLNNVLKITLKGRVELQCPSAQNSTVVLKANFIAFSEFIDTNGRFKGCGWGTIASLEIYALNALFIDRDLDAVGARLKLSIVAPTWEVIGI